MKEIYMDHAATTPLAPAVLEAMLPYFGGKFGNASTVYRRGQRARMAIEDSRRRLAALLHARPEEICFTSGGSESDNMALRCGLAAARKKAAAAGCEKNHIIVSAIEHHAVLHTCEALAAEGVEVTYLPVDERGLVDPIKLAALIRPETALVSVMCANNEIGTLEPIAEIGSLCREAGVFFHTDAVQAFGQIPLDVQALQVDLLSASAHKLNGPQGVGLLYIRRGLQLPSLIHGGAQERGRRAGTENLAGIVGFARAAELAMETMAERTAREREIRDHMIRRLTTEIPACRLNGDPEKRLPNNVHVLLPCVEGESLLLLLDQKGIAAASGSACASGSLEPSHVLRAIGLSHEDAFSGLRLSLGAETTLEDADYVVDNLKEIVDKLRQRNPRWQSGLPR